jgi:glycosyltransferase involved in cell wall biosynthesis
MPGGSNVIGNSNGNGAQVERVASVLTDAPNGVVPNGREHAAEQVAQISRRLRTQGWHARVDELTLSVVIPTWNEAANIGQVLRQLDRFDDVVLVDGQSEDDTVQIARAVRPDVRVVERRPRGKGDALRAGFSAARGDVIVIMDADGSMDPAEVDVFVSMIAVGFDLVKGSRLACGGGSHDLTFVRWAGNRALCGLANRLFRTSWTDLCYGYLAFRRDCLDRLALTADGFEIESQILANAALAGLRVAEVPSVEFPRLSGDSHLNARRDGTRILRTMLSARFSPRARRSAMALRATPSE